MQGFEYPTERHVRRHGPSGYTDFASFRDWLRDEFTFCCVFCLHREQWYGRSGTFDIEHFVPVSIHPDGKCVYTNLLYACTMCNIAKSNVLSMPDPCEVAIGDCLRVGSNGEVEALNASGKKLRDVLRLNHPTNVSYRSRWMRTLQTLQCENPSLYREYMAFPDDLPDLRTKRVKNSKPDGAENCYFVVRERGELPHTY
jgi:hypothetical protein